MPTPRPAAHSFRDLVVWQKAHEFVLAVYRLTESFPDREKFGLAHQMRRAAVSIPANIAEGHARSTSKDYANFISIARGSLMEAETLTAIARRLEYAQAKDVELLEAAMNEIERMLAALHSRLTK